MSDYVFDLNEGIRLLIGVVVLVLAILAYYELLPRLRSIMSSGTGTVPMPSQNETEQRSDAAERPTEPLGTEDRNGVPVLVEQLSALDDDAILDLLALLRTADGDYRYAESRVAKFIPGRVEDRLDQVRTVRGTKKPEIAGRVLRVRDDHGERVIPFR